MKPEDIAAESTVLKLLNREQRRCLAGTAAASLPDDDLQENLWSSTLLLVIIRALSLDEDEATALEYVTSAGQKILPESCRTTWDVRASAFASDSEVCAVDSSPSSEVCRRSMIRFHKSIAHATPSANNGYVLTNSILIQRDLLAIVALSFGYDARTRNVFRRMAWALQIPWVPYMRDLESNLAHSLYMNELAVLDAQKKWRKRDPWRYAKIGLYTVAGGAILAVTGGLAAPALAAGMLTSAALIGGIVGTAATSLAAFSTTAIVATLFGVGGAGLVGYKFNRRIASIGEFKFVPGNETHEMGVAICVPGILAEKEDLHRVWGSDFGKFYFDEELTSEEVLGQYFFVVDPPRINNVPELIRNHRNSFQDLCHTLLTEYGLDPLKPLTHKEVKEWRTRKYGVIIGASSLGESTNAHDLEVIDKLVRVAFKADLSNEEEQQQVREKKEVVPLTDGLFIDDADSKAAVKDVTGETLPPCHLRPSNVLFEEKAARITAMGGEQEEDIEEEADSVLSSVNSSFEEETKSAKDDQENNNDGEEDEEVVVKNRTEEIYESSSPTPLPMNLFSIEETKTKTTNSAECITMSNEQICAGLEYLWGQATADSSSSTASRKEEEQQTENMKEEHKTTSNNNVSSFEQVSRSRMNVEDEEPFLIMDEEKDGATGDIINQPNETEEEELMREQYSCHSDSDLSESSHMLLADTNAKDLPNNGKTTETEEFHRSDDKWKWRVWFWEETYPCNDQYLLQWEIPMLLELGKSVRNVVSKAGSMMAQQALKYTLLSAVMAAVALPLTLISLADLIDTDWTVAVKKAELAGKILARVLLERPQGARPVTLIASRIFAFIPTKPHFSKSKPNSIGAQVVLSCLEELSRRQELWDRVVKDSRSTEDTNKGKRKKSSLTNRKYKDARNVAGLIDDVIILGGAVCVDRNTWSKALRVCHGRFVNGFCPGDWVLGLIYRAKLLSINVAGLRSVSLPGVYNVDLTSASISNQYDFTRSHLPEMLNLVEDALQKALPP